MPAESQNPNHRKVMATINMTPLVDITMVLLIIFMVTATFVKEPVISVELPSAAAANDPRTDTLSLVLNKKGVLHINGKSITHEAAFETLKANREKNPEIQVVVAADGNVAHKDVVHLLDLVKSAGLKNFALGVRVENKQE